MIVVVVSFSLRLASSEPTVSTSKFSSDKKKGVYLLCETRNRSRRSTVTMERSWCTFTVGELAIRFDSIDMVAVFLDLMKRQLSSAHTTCGTHDTFSY